MRFLVFWVAIAALAVQPAVVEVSVTIPGGSVKYLRSESTGEGKAPLVIVLPGGNATPESARATFAQWNAALAARGWRTIVPLLFAGYDPGVKALDLAVADAKKSLHGDELAVFLVGVGGSASEVFYAASRIPDHFTAGLAIQGNPALAINTNRLFGSNTQALPVLWVNPSPGSETSRQRLTAAGYNVEIRSEATDAQVLDWLASQRRSANPGTVDCETGSPAFARCYWLEMTKFDPRKRNDALPSTRVQPGSGASLDLGGFGYDPAGAGPGVLVGWLPEAYKGPLKLNDRIISVAGREIKDSRDYAQHMDELKEEKPVAVMISRAGEKVRVETRISLPKREELVTARVQGTYSSEQKEILLITRTVSEMRVNVPSEWAPANISWNGNDLRVEAQGCWVLNHEKEPPSVSRCP